MEKLLSIQAGIEAGKEVREQTLQACRDLGLTPDYVLKGIKALTKACHVKAHYQPTVIAKHPETGKIGKIDGHWSYSKKFTDNRTRLDALKELLVILDMLPERNEKLSVDLKVDDARAKLLDKINAIADTATKKSGDYEPEPK